MYFKKDDDENWIYKVFASLMTETISKSRLKTYISSTTKKHFLMILKLTVRSLMWYIYFFAKGEQKQKAASTPQLVIFQ